jgi:hypothetical protein
MQFHCDLTTIKFRSLDNTSTIPGFSDINIRLPINIDVNNISKLSANLPINIMESFRFNSIRSGLINLVKASLWQTLIDNKANITQPINISDLLNLPVNFNMNMTVGSMIDDILDKIANGAINQLIVTKYKSILGPPSAQPPNAQASNPQANAPPNAQANAPTNFRSIASTNLIYGQFSHPNGTTVNVPLTTNFTQKIFPNTTKTVNTNISETARIGMQELKKIHTIFFDIVNTIDNINNNNAVEYLETIETCKTILDNFIANAIKTKNIIPRPKRGRSAAKASAKPQKAVGSGISTRNKKISQTDEEFEDVDEMARNKKFMRQQTTELEKFNL